MTSQRDLEAAWQNYVLAGLRERGWLFRHETTKFPHYSEGGRWSTLEVGQESASTDGSYDHGNWTAGFALGVMWVLSLATGVHAVEQVVRRRLAPLARRASDTTTHDLGFLFHPSFVLGQLVGTLDAREVEPARRASRSLARRFNKRGGYIQAFGAIGDSHLAGTSTIDTMMNLPLLWWAAASIPDHPMGSVAMTHARTSARLFFRPDGSTYHLLTFDPLSGSVLKRGTFQGSSDESCWSRGQAWAVAGFAWAYAASGDAEFLAASERAANFFLDHLPSDGLAPWDFTVVDRDDPTDASASAIAALGLLILEAAHPDQTVAERWGNLGRELLVRLDSACVNKTSEVDGILLKSCYSRPHGLGLHGAVAWGDFFYGLAIALAMQLLTVDRLIPRPGSDASQDFTEGGEAVACG